MARENQFATFHNKASAKVDLVSIDKVLRKLVDGHLDPVPLMPMQFFLRSHSCFRAAAECAMSGQIYEATVLMRATLESAAYGLHVGSDEARAKLWFSRGDSKSAGERVRSDFSYGNLKRHFEADYPALASVFVYLYETLIDFGAHPNEAGFSISTAIRREGDKRLFDTIYLHDDNLALDFGLKNTARVAVWVALAYREVYPVLYEKCEVADVVQEMVGRL
jgi:hypothetical protein